MNMRMVFWLCVGWGVTAGVATGAGVVRIVDAGRARAVVSLAGDVDGQTEQAAKLLVQYVKQSSGAELPIVTSPAKTADTVVIHVGSDAYVRKLSLGLDKLDDDGFVIRAADGHVVIAGPTPYGTEFGVCEFLERYVGVRWLMPGPSGTDVPQRKTIDVPAVTLRQEPAFFSRQFSGLRGAPQTTWARRNRMHGRVQFHHNLHRLFPPETYTKTHPHFFPIRKGKRYFPADNNTHGWQPCFSATGLVDEAVRNINRYFDEHPEASSYSLGVIDSSGHCECDACQAQDPPEKNFLGRRDVSDRYYGWCNRVVERVLEKHPDKFFGCLAYSAVAQPPSRVKVHPRIIPYMTYDRMKWMDPELRASGEAMTRSWQRMSPTVGWYDYIYGVFYCVPRVWFHHMGDYYRFAHAHGVRAMYAEAYPTWGEGPKLYVSLKLQWDPTRDVDALLTEWYTRAVGPDAADDLGAYYAHWEDFWTRRILQSKWFTPGGQYLRFYEPSYLNDVTDADLTRSRTLLERVVSKTRTPEQKARAGVLMKAFEYYEASAIAYRGDRIPRETAVRTEADALRMLDRSRRVLEMAHKRLQLLTVEFPREPALLHRLDFTRRPKLRGATWGAGMLWSVFDHAAASAAVRDRLRTLAASPIPRVNLPAKTMLALLEGTPKPLSRNPSFEATDGKSPAEWSRWVKWGTGSLKASPAAADTGKVGIVCRGVKRGGPHQTMNITPGRYAAVAFVRIPQPVGAESTITLQLTPLDEKGANLTSAMLSTAAPGRTCDWTRLAVAGEIPAAVGGKRIRKVRMIVIVDGFGPKEEVHLDDIALYRID